MSVSIRNTVLMAFSRFQAVILQQRKGRSKQQYKCLRLAGVFCFLNRREEFISGEKEREKERWKGAKKEMKEVGFKQREQ